MKMTKSKINPKPTNDPKPIDPLQHIHAFCHFVMKKKSHCSAISACVSVPPSPVSHKDSEIRRWKHYIIVCANKSDVKMHQKPTSASSVEKVFRNAKEYMQTAGAENHLRSLQGLLTHYKFESATEGCWISLTQSSIYLWPHRHFCFPVPVPVDELCDWVHQFGVLRTHG